MKRLLIPAIAALMMINLWIPSRLFQEQFDSISNEIKAQFAPDRRDKCYEPILKDADGRKVLYGSTTEQEAKMHCWQLFLKRSQCAGQYDSAFGPEFGDKIWGVVSHSVANVI